MKHLIHLKKNVNIDDLLVTNIDVDHLDYFKNFNNLLNTFKHVIQDVKHNLVAGTQ